MHDLMQTGLDFADRDVPALGGCGLKHLPGSGTDLPHRLDEVTHTPRAVGVLVTVSLLVARRLHNAHPCPVGIELVGYDHGERRASRPGTHLSAGSDDLDGSILVDGNEDVRVGHNAMRHLVSAGGIGHGAANRRKLCGENKQA